jgi:hypothetical protein
MKHIDIDLENQDFADEFIRHIENDYGRSVARIADFKRTGLNTFDLKIIFSDFRLLEAEMRVVPQMFDFPCIQIHGIYY